MIIVDCLYYSITSTYFEGTKCIIARLVGYSRDGKPDKLQVNIGSHDNLGGINMLSEIPIDLEKLSTEDRDREILRVGMIAELDAVNLYEQLAAMAEREEIKTVLIDIAKEEKTHMGEFQTLLLRVDEEQVEELEKGKEEVEEMLK
jgi:hypothetical protein